MKISHLILFAAFANIATLSAQVATAGIFGTVSDRSGGLVANATVNAINVETNIVRTMRSESAGEYDFTGADTEPRPEGAVQRRLFTQTR